MNDYLSWFETFRQSKDYQFLHTKPIAYFCAEYALSDSLPSYAGGLGVLAGDFIRELSDQKIPAVAVGLFYRSKYGVIDPQEKARKELFPPNPEEHGVKPVLDQDNKPLLIKIPIHDHDVIAKVWLWQKDSIPLYLLDTNIEQNSPTDREITIQLYDARKEIRLKQEIILGIGGFRLLEALKIEPSIYHMNEGHSALLALEIIRHEMHKHKIGFTDAQALSAHHVLFTNHTLVSAGNEVFSNELFTMMLSRYASQLEIPVTEIVALGEIPESHSFSLSVFARRLAGKVNTVSKLHGKTAAAMWGISDVESVTNGIHLPSWDKITTTNLVQAHKENKKALLAYIQEKTGKQWRENELLLGWARRMVRYKRPLALFGELERFIYLASKVETPIKVVMAGIPHQSDDEGRELLSTLQELIKNNFSESVVYLSGYNVTLAKLLTSGCDVWLNTPVVGSEACGTSGMKASLNGTLACTTKDGWVDEIDVTKIGWLVNSDIIHDDLHDVLEKQIVPQYYASNKSKWEDLMKSGRQVIQDNFSATKMLKDYIERLYLPILTTSYEHYSSSAIIHV